jgi:hypothetical protein
MKWRPNPEGDIDRSPQISHKPLMVEQPTVAIVKRPTHFELMEKPKPRPVRNSHSFHWKENGCSLGSENFIHAIVVKEMKKRRGESSNINLLFATNPFSIDRPWIREFSPFLITFLNQVLPKHTKDAATIAAEVE